MKTTYNPHYFLAALGNGGLGVSFFMYLMFLVPHKGTPMATFDHIFPYITAENKLVSSSIILALAGLVYFSVRHFEKLIWNIQEFNRFKKTDAYQNLRSSNAEVSLMAVPLTISMSINVLFVLGAVFVPGLWNYIQLLLPFSLAGFLIVGYFALKIYVRMIVRFMTEKTFKEEMNNSFAQLLSVFAFTMIAVGLAAPGAMSDSIIVSAIGIFFAILFTVLSLVILSIFGTLGLQSILKNGFAVEAAPSVWMAIPIITLVGITFVRVSSGLAHNFLGTDPHPLIFFIGLGAMIAMQIVVGIIGFAVLSKTRYFEMFTKGEKKSPGSYGLICPGVAFFVFGMFFIHWGLVENGIVAKYSIAHYALMIPFFLIQMKTIQVLTSLNRKHFGSSAKKVVVQNKTA